jgi:protein-disulfide isomerase
MQNIWGIIVGVVIAAGIGVVVYKAVDGGGDSRPRTTAQASAPAPAEGSGDTAARTAPLPQPDVKFGQMAVSEDDFQMGRADAPITIIEYASLTCPHCAQFDTEVLPKLKSEYIDTGKVRFVYRDFPLDRLALTASVVARCAGRDRYFGYLNAFFASQQTWARAQNPVEALGRIARLGGMSDAAFDACLKDQKTLDAVLAQRLEAEKTYKLQATPTLFIQGDRYTGGLRFDELKRLIDSTLSKS